MTPAQLAIFIVSTCTAVRAVPTGNHTCTGITKIPVTVLVNVTVPVTFRSYTWCLRVPPRCSKYTVQLRDRVQLHSEMHNKTITVCCRGYVEMDGRCVPACPEGADCPFMHCNRTNHCHCTPGYTGLYCNDPCPRGVWGKDCKRPCDCPTGYTCHHLTGDCFVDDRPPRKTTTTTTTAAPKTTTTLLPTVTTQSTTLETVKTPVFRFPPPPWVDSTTVKKLTTKVTQDDPTTTGPQVTPDIVESVRTPILDAPTTQPRTLRYPQQLPTGYITLSPVTTYQTTQPSINTIPESTISIWPQEEIIISTTQQTTTDIPTTAATSPTVITDTTVSNTKPTKPIQDITSQSQSYIVSSSSPPPTVQSTKPTSTEIPTTETISNINNNFITSETTTTTVSQPEFKVIKIIKTEQSLPKLHKVTKQQEQDNSSADDITVNNNKTKTGNEHTITSTVLKPFTKIKSEGSQIIYISPTINNNKQQYSEIITKQTPNRTTKLNLMTTEITKDFTLNSKSGGVSSLENEVILKSLDYTDDVINTSQTDISPLYSTLQTYVQIPNTVITQLYNVTDTPQTDSTKLLLENNKLNTETNKMENIHQTYTTSKLSDETIQTTTPLIKKKNKDVALKKIIDDKVEMKVLKKVTTTTTLSPIHLLKQLLNDTSKPKVTTFEPVQGTIMEEPLLKYSLDDTKELSKKTRQDDIIVPHHVTIEKNKKKHDKTKQNKHNIKDYNQFPTQNGEISLTTTEQPYRKNALTPSNSYEKEDYITSTEQTTHFPNQIWPVIMNSDVNTPESVKGFRTFVVTKRSTQTEDVTDTNGVFGSNQIDTFHTSNDLPVKSYLNEERPNLDQNLFEKKEVIYNKNNGSIFDPLPAGTHLVVGFGLIMLLALLIAFWIYCKAKRKIIKTKLEPCIMAYQLAEPTPSEVHTLEQTFFCPTFTNNYAAKINRELNELSYDHPKTTKSEPLYAEVKY